MDFGIIAGDTDQTIYVRLRDSTTGLAKTGLAYNSAGAVCSYVLPGAARAAITLATQTVTGAHSDGGFVEVDSTNCKGLYRLDLPDAAIASGKYSLISIEFDGIIEETMIVPLSLRKSDVVNAGGTAWGSGAITAASIASDAITAAKIATDAITSSQLAASAISEIQSGLSTLTQTQVTGGAYALNSASFAFNAAVNNAIADAVWEEAITDHSGTAGSTAEALNAAGSAGDPWTTSLPGSYTGSQAGKILADILVDTGTTLDGRLPAALVSGKMDSVLADGVLHGGSSALIQFGSTSTPPVTISNSGGHTISLACSSTGSRVINVSATGTNSSSNAIRLSATNAQALSITGNTSSNIGENTISSGATDATNVYSILGGITSLAAWLGAMAGKQTADSTAITEIQATGAGSGTYDATTDSQEAIRDRGDSAWITATGFSTLDAAGVRTALGMSSANLDTQLSNLSSAIDAVDNFIDTEVASILQDTGTDIPAQIAALLTTAGTESYRADGATGSVFQLLYETIGHLGESSISGTTKTVDKVDGSTPAMTFTLDDGTTPTAITRAT